MNAQGWIAISGILVTVIISILAALKLYAVKDLEFQERSGVALARMMVEIKRLQIDYDSLHQWKNIRFDGIMTQQTENILNVMSRIEREIDRRLERIEKHLNGALK